MLENIWTIKQFNRVEVRGKKMNWSKHLLNSQYSVNGNIKFIAPILKWDLCDYSNVYSFVKLTRKLNTSVNDDLSKRCCT